MDDETRTRFDRIDERLEGMKKQLDETTSAAQSAASEATEKGVGCFGLMLLFYIAYVVS